MKATKDVGEHIKDFVKAWNVVYRDENIYVLKSGKETYRVHLKCESDAQKGQGHFPSGTKHNSPTLDVYVCTDPPCPDGLE